MDRHGFDASAFVWGIVFVALGALTLAGPLRLPEFNLIWMVPVALVATGIAGLISTLRRPQRTGK